MNNQDQNPDIEPSTELHENTPFGASYAEQSVPNEPLSPAGPEPGTTIASVEQKTVPAPAQPSPTQTTLGPVTVVGAKEKNSAGVIILQWLTYAFWGWTVLASGFLLSVIFNFLWDKSNNDFDTTALPYALSSVVVLAIVAIVCDVLYRTREPIIKKGAAMVIMIIHAVIFALCGIGTLIFGIFSFISLLTSNDSTDGSGVAIVTALCMTILYAVTFLRTLAPKNPRMWSKLYLIFMGIALITMITSAIVGPLVSSVSSKQDHQVSQALTDIDSSIQNYAINKNMPPRTLSDLEQDSDASIVFSSSDKSVIDKNLVTYSSEASGTYQLCGTFTTNQKPSSYAGGTAFQGENEYTTHPAGKKCWNSDVSMYVSNG